VSPVRRCRDDERAAILEIVNAAAEAYRGVIPPDRWHEPYMPAGELDAEIAAGVVFWGYEHGGALLGVMGLQRVRDVELIRHAYVAPGSQRRGARAPRRGEHATDARRHLGGGRVGDPVLRRARLRARLARADRRAAQALLDDPRAPDRGVGRPGAAAGALRKRRSDSVSASGASSGMK
jgi:hypothetical protein